MDAVVIATAVQGDLTRDKDWGQVLMKIEKVLKGSKLVKAGQEVRAIYYGDVTKGRRFMMSEWTARIAMVLSTADRAGRGVRRRSDGDFR